MVLLHRLSNSCGTRYKLDNLPALKTCVARLKAGVPPGIVLTTLAGDFLAPSLLSSIDHGRGMARASNRASPQHGTHTLWRYRCQLKSPCPKNALSPTSPNPGGLHE